MRIAIANLKSVYKRQKLVFTDGPDDQSRSLDVLADETLNISHQLRSCLLSVIRWRIPPPADKVTCPLPVLDTVVQDTPHVKASTTVRINQRLRWRMKPGPAQQPGLDELFVRHEQFLTELREDVKHDYNR